MTVIARPSIPLPLLDDGPQRPSFAQGPRALSSVKLLRISVTDRCNLRCIYCMPEGGVEFSDKDELLQPGDFEAIARAAVRIGVTHLKLTGGEPTIRRDIVDIAARLKAAGAEDLSLTTNALQLPRLAADLRAAGVDRLTLSIDSLRPDRYTAITQGGRIERFWAGVEAAEAAGYERLKLNVVVIKGMNDDEAADFAALTLDRPWTVRFIEYMPLGVSQLVGDGIDPTDVMIDNADVMRSIAAAHGPLAPADRRAEAGVGPAEVYRLPGASGKVGFISAMSQPFCETCNRLRLTATGELRSCLFDGGEVSVVPALRPHADVDAIVRAFGECVVLKPETHSSRGNRAMSQLGG